MSLSAEDFLSRAKEALKQGSAHEALSLLRRASYEEDSDYGFSSKAARLASKLTASSPALGLKEVKLAILSSTTTVFLEPLIKYFGVLAGLNIELKSGDFGMWRQEILNADSWIYTFKPNFTLINTNFRDFPLPAFSDSAELEIQNASEELSGLWQILSSRIAAKIIQNDIDIPRYESGGYASSMSQNGRLNVLAKISQTLREKAAEQKVQIANFADVQSRMGDKWFDATNWYHCRQHPALQSLPSLAKEYVRIIKMHLGLTKKVLVCDLDNTLWGGVIGEDGLNGIRLGAPDASGEAFCDFQKYILELKNRGILIAVCSKNNEEDAMLPFQKHPEMKLKLDDIVCFKANWERKSDNISSIAKELSLGLDSFVFIDDNPMEIEEVSAVLPQVECLKMPKDAALFIERLDRRCFFDTTAISKDDLQRNQTYKANSQRLELQSANPEDFLKKFEMKCRIGDIADNLERCIQLINKTNQFNLTTKRLTDAEAKSIVESEGAWCKCFSLSDKFGDSGIVGICIARKDSSAAWSIHSLLMSCRVLGRGLEFLIVNSLCEHVKKQGGGEIKAQFIPTKKNSQVSDFYDKCAFTLQSENADGTKNYSCKTGDFTPINTFIEIE